MQRALLLALLLSGCFFEPDRPGGSTPGDDVDATQLTVGGKHACVIDDNQTIRCWGANSAGEVDASMQDVPAPTVVSGTGFTDISAGAHHTCGIEAGEVVCWGDGSPATAVELPAGAVPDEVYAGADATCAIDETGALYCWGAIDATQAPFTEPRQVDPSGAGAQFAQVAIADDHACARTNDNDVYCWGKGTNHQLTGTVSRAIDSAVEFPMQLSWISVATGASCGVTADNADIICWGSAANGQLGDQTSDSDGVLVDTTDTWARVRVSADHGCAVSAGGAVGCWGDNTRGALGDGFDAHRSLQVIDADFGSVHSVGVGEDFSCALDDQGAVYCWGSNTNGELGNGEIATSRAPVTVTDLPSGTVSSLVAGDGYSCAIVARSLYCWGDNRVGQTSTTSAMPVLATATKAVLDPVDLVTAGARHTCTISNDDASLAHCWGANDAGQLGSGAADPISTVDVHANSSAAMWTEISAGTSTTCARTVDSTVVCWGALKAGGTVNEINSSAPNYDGPIASGNAFTLVVDHVGGLEAFGTGGDAATNGCEHQLGGNENSLNTLIGSSTHVAYQLAVANGDGAHFCIRFDDSGATTVACAGKNDQHQAGDEATCNLTAVTAPAVGWAASSAAETLLSVSGDHSCALGGDGHIYCWGANERGELATLPAVSTAPAAVGTGTYSAIATGAFHTCAITADGQHVQCWGENRFGELGNGKRFHETPVLVTF